MIIPIIIILVIIIMPITVSDADNKKEDSFENKNIYICDIPNIEMECNDLSQINKNGHQTRCYFYNERITYKICNKGWRLK